MKVFTKIMVILGLMVVPFTVCNADATTDLFTIQTKLALKGKPQDQYFLGVMYEEGLGTQADLKFARMWFEKSARQNYAQAITKLKELDNQRGAETTVVLDDPYAANPKKKKLARKTVSTSTKFARQEMIAKKEIERKRRAWQKAMNKQSQYAEDAFE